MLGDVSWAKARENQPKMFDTDFLHFLARDATTKRTLIYYGKEFFIKGTQESLYNKVCICDVELLYIIKNYHMIFQFYI